MFVIKFEMLSRNLSRAPAEIRAGHLPNTSSMCYHLNQQRVGITLYRIGKYLILVSR
jgi:hypothetical protein